MIKPNQADRRKEPRLLCADLVTVTWVDQKGVKRKEIANLEDFSEHGACIQMESEIPSGTPVQIIAGKARIRGEARYSREDELGWFVGIQMAAGTAWPKDTFQPKHILDPRILLADRALRNLKT
jgi:hypothetical protein